MYVTAMSEVISGRIDFICSLISGYSLKIYLVQK